MLICLHFIRLHRSLTLGLISLQSRWCSGSKLLFRKTKCLVIFKFSYARLCVILCNNCHIFQILSDAMHIFGISFVAYIFDRILLVI